MTALEPALGLLSALTSLPAVLYYARALGAAAVHPVRGGGGRIAGLRANADWARTLIAFLGGTVLVALLADALSATLGAVMSLHAALGAVVVAAVWRHARETLVRLLLLLLLIGAGVSRLLPGTEAPAAILAGYAVGLCCIWTAHVYIIRAKHARRQ
jgi:hypothetical protein